MKWHGLRSTGPGFVPVGKDQCHCSCDSGRVTNR
uniref:Uncharacterized protein n=1 Tax=Anguilla anguilla TaxID=7936 RepID=A0A0E9STD6_ANGAN